MRRDPPALWGGGQATLKCLSLPSSPPPTPHPGAAPCASGEYENHFVSGIMGVMKPKRAAGSAASTGADAADFSAMTEGQKSVQWEGFQAALAPALRTFHTAAASASSAGLSSASSGGGGGGGGDSVGRAGSKSRGRRGGSKGRRATGGGGGGGETGSVSLVLDPSRPAFERQHNAVYKVGGSKLYPKPHVRAIAKPVRPGAGAGAAGAELALQRRRLRRTNRLNYWWSPATRPI